MSPECHSDAEYPSCVILSRENIPADVFEVELSKICNKLLIFESQNAVSVLRISDGLLNVF